MKKNIIIVGLLVIAVVVVVGIKSGKFSPGGSLSGCANGVCTLPIPAGRPASEDPQGSASEEKPLPELLELGSLHCVACKTMAPIIEELSETFSGQLKVEFIDVGQDEEAAQLYGIRAIPTQIFFDAEGNELFRHEGFYPRDDIVAKWKELGVALVGE